MTNKLMITYCWPVALSHKRASNFFMTRVSLTKLGKQLLLLGNLVSSLPFVSLTFMGNDILISSRQGLDNKVSTKRKLTEVDKLFSNKRSKLRQLEETSTDRKRKRSGDDEEGLEPKRIKLCGESLERKRRSTAEDEESMSQPPKKLKVDLDFFEAKQVAASLTSPAPVCLASPGLCHQTKVTPRTFPTNILHLLLDEEDQKEDEENVSFKAGSLWSRSLCLSSPGLCSNPKMITKRLFHPNIAKLLVNEIVDKDIDDGDVNTNQNDAEEAHGGAFEEEPIKFKVGSLSPPPSLCLAPATCFCKSRRSLSAFASRAWSPPPKVLALLLEEENEALLSC